MTRIPSENILESLSALVDNEASEIERHRILKNFSSNTELRDKWRRYHVIGSVMRREHNIASHIDVSAAVAAAIAGEDSAAGAPSAAATGADLGNRSSAPGERKRWQDLVGKAAIAASFAAVMVVGVSQFSPQQNSVADSANLQVAGGQRATAPTELNNVTSAPLGFELPMPAARTVSSNALSSGDPMQPVPRALLPENSGDLTDPVTQELLNHLLIEHAARSSANGGLGILPFARVSKMEESER